MRQWERRLELADIWKQRERDEIEIPELGKEIANRLRLLNLQSHEMDGLIEEFDCVEDDMEEFDSILERLYDWADVGKRLWIATSSF